MLQEFASGADWQYFVSVALVSLYVSTTAVALSTLVSVPVALAIGFTEFPGKRGVTAVINTGMGFPSVVVGLLVLLLLSNQGPLGELGLVFTPTAMIASQFVLATPVVTSISLSAVESVGRDVRDAAFTLGGTDGDVGLLVVKEARYGIVTAVLAGYGRAISEVGSILIVGGNIVLTDTTGAKTSYTRTLTTAITVEARQGRYEAGLVLGAMLLVLVLCVNVLGSWVRSRSRGRGEVRR
ncbi:ABC transporter permease [Haladaptatus salinisoli]|uniref:ABC transporter permease n=1 Tax=Haladaptatus salinisoli TaxID=2884876 RepID=UPI001D0B0D41|nr:ABC transporter permease [Haladaptatus salinisoli]